MTYRQIILSHIFDYLNIKKYKFEHFGKVINLMCPFCKDKSLTAQVIAHTHKIKCLNENCPREGKSFTLISIVKRTEKGKKNWDNERILEYLKKLLKVKTLTPKDKQRIKELFDKYEKYGWSLIPIAKNKKDPPVAKWRNVEYRDKLEWMEWIELGLNVAVKTGKSSNLTIIDIDKKSIPKEIEEYLKDTFAEESRNGFHYYFLYEEILPKYRIDKYKIDIENEGGMVTIAPSIVENIPRKILNDNEVLKMPKELKDFLLKHIPKGINKDNKTYSEQIREDIETENYRKPLLEEGDGRNELFLRLSCMWRKFLNREQVKRVARILDKVICVPPLADELENTVFKSMDKYNFIEDEEMVAQILDYLKEAGQVEKRDIERVIIGNYEEGEQKAKLDKALAYCLREDLIQKRGRFYELVKRLEWKTSLLEGVKPLKFKVPYFDDLMYFNYGDVIVIGAKPGHGKTHIALNIIKQLINQKIKPKYISLESGSRFKKIALELGIVEGEFEYAKCQDPTKVELEDNAITIIDWLLPNQYKYTDKIIGHFNEQLEKHGGFLFLFVQLRKSNGDWFAKDLLEFFPALALKYSLEDEKDGTFGHFEICKARDSQRKRRLGDLPCQFDGETKVLTRIDELKDIKTNNKPEQELEDGKEERDKQ